MTPTTASTPVQQPLRVDAGPPRPNAIAAISLSNDWGPPLPGQVRAGTFGHPTHAIRGSRRLARDPGRRARRGGCRRIALDRAAATSYEAQCIAAHVAGIHPHLDAEGNANQPTASTFPLPSSLRPEGPQRSAGAAWRLDPATFIRHSADPPGTPSRIHQTTRASRHQKPLASSRSCFSLVDPSDEDICPKARRTAGDIAHDAGVEFLSDERRRVWLRPCVPDSGHTLFPKTSAWIECPGRSRARRIRIEPRARPVRHVLRQ